MTPARFWFLATLGTLLAWLAGVAAHRWFGWPDWAAIGTAAVAALVAGALLASIDGEKP